MGRRTKQESTSPEAHAHASLFSPSSKFRVEYKHVVEAPVTVTHIQQSLRNEEDLGASNSMKGSKRRDGQQQTRRPVKHARRDTRSPDTIATGPGTCSDNDNDEDSENHMDVMREAPEDTPKNATRKVKPAVDDKLANLLDDALDRTIFVGNISESTTKKKLKSHFERYGEVESVRFRSMMLVKDSKVPRRAAAASGTVDTERGSFHAYVVFESIQSVPKSLQENMKVLDGRHLRVDRAAVNKMRVKLLGASKGYRAAAELVSGSHQVHYDVHKSVFIGNLPLTIEDEDLIRFFIAGLGTGSDPLLEAVRIVRDPKTSVGKGIAFALFKTRPACKQALKLNGKILNGRKLRITEVQADPGSEASQYTRVTSKKANQSWQGATSTKSGRVRGINKKTLSTPGTSQFQVKGQKRTGKRPAVAARKLAMKRGLHKTAGKL